MPRQLLQAPEEIEAALSAMRRRGADAVLVMHQPFSFEHRTRIVNAVARIGVPAMYGNRQAVEAGGLISYSASVPDIFRRAAFLVDKILHGAKPVDLPVEQPTALELAINLKTAKAFGVTIPKTVLMRADEVIQ